MRIRQIGVWISLFYLLSLVLACSTSDRETSPTTIDPAGSEKLSQGNAQRFEAGSYGYQCPVGFEENDEKTIHITYPVEPEIWSVGDTIVLGFCVEDSLAADIEGGGFELRFDNDPISILEIDFADATLKSQLLSGRYPWVIPDKLERLNIETGVNEWVSPVCSSCYVRVKGYDGPFAVDDYGNSAVISIAD